MGIASNVLRSTSYAGPPRASRLCRGVGLVLVGLGAASASPIDAQRADSARPASREVPATLTADTIASRSPVAAAAVDAAARALDLSPLAAQHIWPGFRPDTLAVVLGVPEVGWLLTGWPGDLPTGFAPVAGTGWVAWRWVVPDGGDVANVIDGAGRPWLSYGASGNRAVDLGNLIHEAFHLLQRSLRADGRYPGGENSFRVTTYPEFDAANETGHALEGRLLADAVRSLPDTATAARRVREFLAAREGRQRRMQPEDALFEIRTELNEGVAQYAYVRALQVVADRGDAEGWAGDAAAEVETQVAHLEDLIAGRRQSVRLRFYTTGFAQALLLDAFAGNSWKRAVMEEGATLQDLLADATGHRAREVALVEQARRRYAGLDEAGERAVRDLLADRRERVEQALAKPGVRIDIDGAALPGGIGVCGIDPQNLLQVSATLLLHGRWLRPCAGGFRADLTVETVHDREAHTLAFVLPADGLTVAVDGARLEIPADGAPLEIPADETPKEHTGVVSLERDGVTLRADRARVRVAAGAVRIVLQPVE